MAALKHETYIRASGRFPRIDFPELQRYSPVMFYLAWRSISIKYKQTLIGIGWALLQPIATMVVFTVIFGKLANLPSEGVPYFMLTLTGILPWQLFSQAVTNSTDSVVNEKAMITKIYFPRLILPCAAVLASVTEFGIALLVLFGLMLVYRVSPGPYIWLSPLFILLALILAMGVGLWLSALNVRYRDVKYAVPFLLQLGWFVSPIGYSTHTVPADWRLAYMLNPMVSVIEGFRFCFLGGTFKLDWTAVLASTVFALLLFLGGLFFFRHTERTFADVI